MRVVGADLGVRPRHLVVVQASCLHPIPYHPRARFLHPPWNPPRTPPLSSILDPCPPCFNPCPPCFNPIIQMPPISVPLPPMGEGQGEGCRGGPRCPPTASCCGAGILPASDPLPSTCPFPPPALESTHQSFIRALRASIRALRASIRLSKSLSFLFPSPSGRGPG